MIRKFFKNAGLLSITEIVLKAKVLIVIPILTRYFGTIDYGAWAQVGVLASTMIPLLIMGTDAAVIRYLPGEDDEKKKRFFCAWFLFLATIFAFVCTVIYIFKDRIAILFFGNAHGYVELVPLAAATLLINMMLNIARMWFRINNDAKIYSFIAIGQAVLGIFAILMALLTKGGLYQVVLYGIAADFIVALWILAKIGKIHGWGKPDFSIIAPLLKYGLPLVPAGFAIWALNYMDRFFLIRYASLADVGIYSLAYSLGYVVIQIFVNPVWAMYPNCVSELYNTNRTDTLRKLFDYSMKLISLIVFPSVILLLIFGRQILAIAATHDFLRGAPIISIIACGYFFLMCSSYYDISLGLVHKQYLSTVSAVLACAINFFLNLLLVPRYSIFGAAAATLISFLCQFAFSYLFERRLAKILDTDFAFIIRAFAVSVLSGLIIYSIVYYVKPINIIHNMLFGTLGFIIYAILIVAFRVVKIDSIKEGLLFIREGF
jgi:O-antigen/teichoic acid export membrane protein